MAQTVEVFQWTDEDGVVHFSQWAPEEDVSGVETFSVDSRGAAENGIGISEADDPEGWQAHREEMDALWAEMDARREADRERRANQPTTEVVYVYDQPSYGYPFFFNGFRPDRPIHRPGRPPMRPKPPIEEPKPAPVRSVPYRRP